MLIPALSCFGGGAPRPLYRTYEDPQASLSNSYALLSTLVTPTQFNGRKETCHGR